MMVLRNGGRGCGGKKFYPPSSGIVSGPGMVGITFQGNAFWDSELVITHAGSLGDEAGCVVERTLTFSSEKPDLNVYTR
jgi:hypothetical protein